ncbi:MAG: type II secretion system protein M [Moraxellaceae bacterium]|jgi:general secretion pathway protein M|nr:type II secretion system protein M [Moraxellaceae bacterium]MBP9730217.1 type II secretion system protein M [Moraxellaceae bacterium]MCC6200513.1 type II secretion system protein M [Moraxellaceae bacterium]HQV42050.1 type II secretion system protein M [Moraxellaceae bacterium]HQX89799.1 type II secretion system protein M [Moraxellaceae bacterium]
MKEFLMQFSNQWQEAVAPLRKRWLQLAPREQLPLLILAGFVFVLMLIYGIWWPSHKAAESARIAHENNRQLVTWMQANAVRARAAPSASGESVLGAVNSVAGSTGLTLSRIEPEGDSAVRVWVERADFNTIASWLGQLGQSGIVASEIQVEKQSAGGVSGRFTLSR